MCNPPNTSDVKLDVLCKGAMIDRKWALVPAHCVDGKSPDSINVAVGVNSDLDVAGVSAKMYRLGTHMVKG